MGFLIDDNYLKDRINITANKDSGELIKSLQNCQDFYLMDLLGIPLYDHFDNYVNDTGVTLTDIQLLVLEKVKLYAALIVEYDLMLNTFDITNKGTLTDVNSASIELINMRKNVIFNRADAVKSEIIKLIVKNRGEFPQYFDGDDSPEDTCGGSSFSPIVFY